MSALVQSGSPSRSRKTALLSLFAATGALLVSACTSSSAEDKPKLVFKEASKPGVVAKVGGKEITEDELIGDDKLTFYDLEKRLYDFKMGRLKKVMVDVLIGAEAEKAKMSLDDYIEKKITKGKIEVSKKEYDAFVKDKQIPESQINDRLKERINEYLRENKKDELVQAYVAKLTKKSPVEVYFQKPRISINVEVGNAPTWGDKDAKVTIVEFSDFQCPFCARGAKTVNDIKKKYKGKVQIAFRHFPLPMHKEARPAAEASMCVNEQGSDKFWKYHDLLFDNIRALSDDDLAKYAEKVGANVQKFKECYSSKKYAKAVQDDIDYGEKLGVRSTPTFFINGQLISGAVPLESFAEIIDEELQ